MPCTPKAGASLSSGNVDFGQRISMRRLYGCSLGCGRKAVISKAILFARAASLAGGVMSYILGVSKTRPRICGLDLCHITWV